MSSSTNPLGIVSPSQAGKEVTINQALNAASPASLYGFRPEGSGGLTWAYWGGFLMVAGVATAIANGTVTLTTNTTNYIQANPATGAVTAVTGSFTAGYVPLYTVVVSATNTYTSWVDRRAFAFALGLAGASQAAVSGTATGTDATLLNDTVTLVNALRTALITSGIIKGAA